jgi:hypothetical protein
MTRQGGPTNATDPANGGKLTDDQLDALLERADRELLHHIQASTDPTATLAELLAAQPGIQPANDPPIAVSQAIKPGHLPHSRRAAPGRLSWRAITIAAAAAVAVIGLAFAAAVSHAKKQEAAPNAHSGPVHIVPTASESIGPGSPPATAIRPTRGPAATVTAYFAAIKNHDYRRAWHLGGEHLAESYRTFKSSLADTTSDSVHILHVHGTVVTADLTAKLTNGTQANFTGTYTVSNGAITRANVLKTELKPYHARTGGVGREVALVCVLCLGRNISPAPITVPS